MTTPSGSAVLVRRARATDLDGIWPLAREIATSYRVRREAFEATFDSLVRDPHALLLVAAVGDETCGYLLAHRHLAFFANGPLVWIEEVMVAEAFRRAGVGRSLMTEVESWASGLGAAYVSLATRRAGPFYRALGYDDSATFYRKVTAGTG